jgi:oxalate decarboxylase
MRLTAGAFRELHWHTAGEWAIMLYGNARITAIDLDGKSFVADVGKDDLWFFPSGIPHSIQGLNPDGCEFMLVFDDGNFSESETVLLSDAMAHLPPEVLAKNFAVNQEAFKNVPKQELFIFQADVPVQWRPIRRQQPVHVESRRRTLLFARCKCRRHEDEGWRGAHC